MKFRALAVPGSLPVRKLCLEGEHTAMLQYELRKLVPALASFERPGVVMNDAPKGSTSGRMSSVSRYSTFFAPAGGGEGGGAGGMEEASGRMMNDDAHVGAAGSNERLDAFFFSQQQPLTCGHAAHLHEAGA